MIILPAFTSKTPVPLITTAGVLTAVVIPAAMTDAVSTPAVVINGTGVFDVNAGKMIIDYTGAANTPVATVRSYLHTGFAGGAWTGTGMTSTAAKNAGTVHPTGIGFAEATSLNNTTNYGNVTF